MANNPFDFDESDAAKAFEKNTIFGIDAEDDDANFMKVSLAAANMNIGVDEYGGNLKPSYRQSQPGNEKAAVGSNFKNVYDDKSKRNSFGSGVSVRGHANTTTTVNKPHFEGSGRKKDINFNSSLEAENTISDVVQKSITIEEYKRLQDELARTKKMTEQLREDKWNSIPVEETVKRIVRGGEPYTLDCYKSMADKKGLLNKAVKCRDGNAIITVVIFLERTLSTRIFQQELSNCSIATQHYIQHLRRNKDWRKLEQFYKDTLRIEDAALLQYELVSQMKDIQERILALHKWLNEHGETKILEIDEMKNHISNEIKLLEKQRQLEVEDKPRELSDPVMSSFPRFCIELKPLIKTVEYCALYHYKQGDHYHPEEFKKVFQLSDKQYEWAVVAPLAYLQRWPDMEQLLTSTRWFGKKSDLSHIGFENVVRVLHKAKANEEILIKYANLISNLDVRIKYAEKLLLHDVVIDAIVQLKDRHRMEEYRTIIGDNSRKHVRKLNDLLDNSSIKWR